MAIPRIIRNFNMFLQGTGFAGIVDEIELPKLSLKTEEHRAGGMDAIAMIDMGMEKIECSFSMAEPNRLLLQDFGLFSGRGVQAQFRAAAADDVSVVPYVVDITGAYTEIDPGTLKAGDKNVLKGTVACRYYKLTLAGAVLVEVDVENMRRIVNGVDTLEAIRAALNMA
jgi:P2 family phage contractile tail tube protein